MDNLFIISSIILYIIGGLLPACVFLIFERSFILKIIYIILWPISLPIKTISLITELKKIKVLLGFLSKGNS